MKKAVKSIGTFVVILVLSVAILTLVLLIKLGFQLDYLVLESFAADKKLQQQAIVALCGMVGALLLIYLIWKFVLHTRNKLHNAGDELFSDVDAWRNIRGKDKLYYDIGINTIKTLYRKDGIVHELVKKRKGNRLQNRKKFLTDQLTFPDEAFQCVIAISQSMIAALILETMHQEEGLISVIFCILLMLLIVAMPFAKHSKHVQLLGELEKAILEFEIAKLDEYIEEYNAQQFVSEIEEKALHTQQIVIIELINRKQKAKGKKRQEIIKDLKLIEGLDLLDCDFSNCYHVESSVGKRKVTLIYRTDDRQRKKNQKPGIPINKSFCELKRIMDKYSMLQ